MEKKKETHKTVKKHTRLTRSEKFRALGGVCGGLAEFFEIDVTIIRIIFVLLTLFGGSGILLYFVLWLVIPSAKDDGVISESTIKESVKEMKISAEKFADKAKTNSNGMNARTLFGVALLVIGILILLDNFGFRFFNMFKLWPLLLIALAFVILTKNGRGE